MIRPFPALSTLSAMIPRWPLLLGVLAGAVFCLTPDSNPDLPLHLAAGRHIVSHRAVPKTEPFSWTRQGQPWIDYEWGAQLVFHALDVAGGEKALWLFKAVAFAALMIPFIALGRLWRLPDSWIGAALFPFMLSFVPYSNVRPEIFSFLFTGIELWALEYLRTRGGKTGQHTTVLILHFLWYSLWSNLHPGYPMGLALCVCYSIGQRLEGKKEPDFRMLLGSALLGSLVNPFGIRLYSTFLKHGSEAAILRANVVEWQWPNPGNLYQSAFWVLFLFSICVALASRLDRRRMPPTHELCIAAFGLASLTAYRQEAYLSLAAFPLALRAAFELEPLWRTFPFRKTALAIGFILLANVAATVLRLERTFQTIGGRYDAVAICKYLKGRPGDLSKLRLFHPWYWGAYMENALAPDYRIFMDGRFGGLFAEFLPILEEASASPERWQAFLDAQGIELAVIDRDRMPFAKAPARSAAKPIDEFYMPRDRWALIYWDRRAAMWVRRSAVDPTWLAAREFRWLHPGGAADLRIALKKGRVSARAVRQELKRYAYDIGDAGETTLWVGQLQKLAGAPRFAAGR